MHYWFASVGSCTVFSWHLQGGHTGWPRRTSHRCHKRGCYIASSRDSEFLFICTATHTWLFAKISLKTTYRQSYGHQTMSVSVEYITDMKRTHPTSKGQFLSFTFLFLSLSLLPSLPLSFSPPAFSLYQLGKEKHVIIQLSKSNSIGTDRAGRRRSAAATQLPCCLCEHKHTSGQQQQQQQQPRSSQASSEPSLLV